MAHCLRMQMRGRGSLQSSAGRDAMPVRDSMEIDTKERNLSTPIEAYVVVQSFYDTDDLMRYRMG